MGSSEVSFPLQKSDGLKMSVREACTGFGGKRSTLQIEGRGQYDLGWFPVSFSGTEQYDRRPKECAQKIRYTKHEANIPGVKGGFAETIE